MNILNDSICSVLRPRLPDSNKGSYGTLTAVLGCEKYRGCAYLAMEGALRCGVGIARLASVEAVVSACAAKISECVYEPLTSNAAGSVSASAIPALLAAAGKSTAVLCGCGMDCCEDTAEITEALIYNFRGQLILDADALNSLAAYRSPSLLRRAALPPVITPHIGEMARLSGRSISDLRSDRGGAAQRFADEYGCVTVLKDHITHVAAPDGRLWQSCAGNAGLARGGSGDLLAGMTASLGAQGIEAAQAAACAVHLHGCAADLCAARLSMRGMLPGDILTDLLTIFKTLENGQIQL